MILQEIFNNNFEILIPEFFLTTILLILLLFGVFYKNNQNNQKILIIKNLNTIIIYLLLILLILTSNIYNISNNVMNGVLVINNFTQFIKIILIICTIICFLIQQKYIIQQKINAYEINILMLISLLGLMVLISSNHFITLYLAIELQSLSFYILTASQKKSILSVEGALKYFILGSIASGFILFGSSILYVITGSLNFNNIFLLLSNVNYIENIDLLLGILYGLIFIVIGILFKIGAAPFHFWLPDVYEGAPNNITSFFAIVPKIAFIGILIRFFFDIFYHISFFFETFFYIIALLSMLIGSLAALQQKKIKRLLAYSSISHVGFILIGFTSNMLNNIPYILLYVIIYIIMSINLWTSYLSLNINHKPVKYLTDLSNIFTINKLIAIIIILNIFSLAGIPPLAGFFSKLFIFFSAIKNNYFSIVFFAVIISIISSFYYLKIIKIIYFEKIVKKIFISKINKIQSIILLINTQFIVLLFVFPNILLVNLNKIYLYLLI
jgi:NADH-quinone oxidoreductase subunit N|uniref:NADH dehydrogenase subunit 2 n=1 Tax=Globisporangium ultimum TaxID=2052682 RepID=D8WJ93_GLOUL|nr:NADH dehydrogenase subunit 2 [Globisporangium ultimum]ACZ43875.1 NADH dehydrogenase subunit 2 [Globisporangium ultimum]ACZ44457.1 NADH dehydrogenase subunit 2 [Globisporangium ultimum]